MEFSEIRGFGVKRIEYMKQSGIESVDDLLMLFPSKYIDLSSTETAASGVGKEKSVIMGTIKAPAQVKYLRKGLFLTTVVMTDGTDDFECGWFNQKYLRNALHIGTEYFVYGKVEQFGKKLSIGNPTLIKKTSNSPKIHPIYKAIKGVPANVLTGGIDAALKNVRLESFVNCDMAKHYNLTELNNAVRILHHPSDMKSLADAKRSIAIENLSCNMALYELIKHTGKKNRKYSDSKEILENFISNLPFDLTNGQKAALDNIISDMRSNTKMNRLLQGDVGCGKTIVALCAMLYAVISGYQCVLMSPTELLAKQHYETAQRLFKAYKIRTTFLGSSLTAKKRLEVLSDISKGNTDIVIGTHAVICKDVVFKHLALIVTDEQQRFGVKQRGLLENKAINADCLVMSATPIPRTLALTLYGDLAESAIHEVPEKKASVTTRFVPTHKIKDMLAYIFEKAKNGEQTYIVCPRIDDDELVSVNTLYNHLKNTALKEYIGILHGQLPDSEKAKIMNAFAEGSIRVLLTTSIIEVGIDVKSATTIVIFNADRYGLSQLHQLRGRVGRGEKDSFCFILSDNYDSESAQARLNHFCSCNDGFSLAEFDFKMRGAGDFFGTRQHGSTFFSEMDAQTIKTAREISLLLLQDEHFCKYAPIKAKNGQITFIEKLTLN